MTDFLRHERHGGVLLLTMDRERTRNALSDADAVEALVQACARIGADLSVRAVVLTGSHGVFSSGGNLKTLSDTVGAGLGEPVHSLQAYRSGIQRIRWRCTTWRSRPLPRSMGRPSAPAATWPACAISGWPPAKPALPRVSSSWA